MRPLGLIGIQWLFGMAEGESMRFDSGCYFEELQ